MIIALDTSISRYCGSLVMPDASNTTIAATAPHASELCFAFLAPTLSNALSIHASNARPTSPPSHNMPMYMLCGCEVCDAVSGLFACDSDA